MKHIPPSVNSVWSRYANWTTVSDTEKSPTDVVEEAGKNNEVNMSDELLLEIGLEFLKHVEHGHTFAAIRAEAAARKSMEIRETGQSHEVLWDALAAQELLEKAVLELGIAIRLFYDQPRHREILVQKAIRLTDLMEDPPLAESIHIAQKMANTKYEAIIKINEN